MTAHTPIGPGNGIDLYQLNRELDKVKTKVFLGRHAAFLGTIMSSLDFVWTSEVETAGTDGESFFWSPDDFLRLPPEERCATVEHELWHVARLHIIRGADKDHRVWNYAADIRINRDLRKEGYPGLGPPMWIPDHPEIPFEVEEDIYDWLIQNNFQPPPGDKSDKHTLPSKPGSKHAAINTVVKAMTQAKLSGAGSLPGDIEEIVRKFLAPVVPWEALLHRFMNDLLDTRYSWRRPNRRHQDIYLPSRFRDDGRLEHLQYFWDVSGSITHDDEVRFNSEVKYIWETYKPKKLTLAQFDTRITSVQVFEDGDPFEEIKIIGRGGTNLGPVREYMIETRPTAAIIFSDLECAPMRPLPFEIPVIWVAVRNRRASVPFGQLIHIKG